MSREKIRQGILVKKIRINILGENLPRVSGRKSAKKFRENLQDVLGKICQDILRKIRQDFMGENLLMYCFSGENSFYPIYNANYIIMHCTV